MQQYEVGTPRLGLPLRLSYMYFLWTKIMANVRIQAIRRVYIKERTKKRGQGGDENILCIYEIKSFVIETRLLA